MHSLREQASSSSRSSSNADQVTPKSKTRVYFSPIVNSESQIELSDPLPTPAPTPSPESSPAGTQHSPNSFQKQERMIGLSSQQPTNNLHLQPHHLTRLLKAFTSASFVRSQVCRPRKHIPQPATTPPPPPSPVSPVNDYPVRLRGVAVTDFRKPGAPLRFTSKGYEKFGNVLRVGGKGFLNAPFGPEWRYVCTLRVEAADEAKEPQVILAIVGEVVDRWTRMWVYDLVVEIDVTQPVTKAVVAEMAFYSDCMAEQIVLPLGSKERDTTAQGEKNAVDSPIDWCALADDLLAESELDNVVDGAAASFAQLTYETCLPETRALFAELELLRQKHEDFVILNISAIAARKRVKAPMLKEAVAKVGVEWISQHLESKLHDELRLSEAERRRFRERICSAVGSKMPEGKAFSAVLELGKGRMVKMFAARLICARGDPIEPWICFFSKDVES